MILSTMLAATILLADTTPAAATAATTPAPAAATAPAKTAAANPTPDKVVCKTEAVTGSMFPKKTCYSTKEFAQRQQEERMNLQKIQEQSH